MFVFSFIEVSFYVSNYLSNALINSSMVEQKNSLIKFQLKIGIILQKVAIPLDVVSINKSCGRIRNGKRSCLIIVDNRQKNLPDLIF